MIRNKVLWYIMLKDIILYLYNFISTEYDYIKKKTASTISHSAMDINSTNQLCLMNITESKFVLSFTVVVYKLFQKIPFFLLFLFILHYILHYYIISLQKWRYLPYQLLNVSSNCQFKLTEWLPSCYHNMSNFNILWKLSIHWPYHDILFHPI